MFKWIWPLAALVTLSSCVGPGVDKPPYPPIDRPPPPQTESAVAAGVEAGPAIASLRLGAQDAAAAACRFISIM